MVGHGQEVLPGHLEGLPVPGAVGGDPLVGREPQPSLAPLVNDGELLALVIGVEVSHGQEDLQQRRRRLVPVLGPAWRQRFPAARDGGRARSAAAEASAGGPWAARDLRGPLRPHTRVRVHQPVGAISMPQTGKGLRTTVSVSVGPGSRSPATPCACLGSRADGFPRTFLNFPIFLRCKVIVFE